MQRVLLTLALVATAGVSYAQQPMAGGEPTDPYGRPLIGRSDWVRQPWVAGRRTHRPSRRVRG